MVSRLPEGAVLGPATAHGVPRGYARPAGKTLYFVIVFVKSDSPADETISISIASSVTTM